VVLGGLAFLGDEIGGVAGTALLFVSSTGFAWAAAAAVAGYLAPSRRAALVRAVALLLAATLAYYLAVTISGDRWRNATLEDGSSALVPSLISVAVATGFWGCASVVGGLALGWLGHAVRTAAARPASVAAGLLLGLLAAEGLFAVVQVTSGGIALGFGRTRLIEGCAQILLAAGGAVAMLARRRGGRIWVAFGLTAAVAGLAALLLWQQIELVRTTGF
jgi:hypothetical protein